MSRTVGRMRRRTALVFVLVVAFFLQGVVTDHSSAGAALARRAKMLQLTNEDRVDRDRDALALNVDLSRYARRHSRQMAERGELFHTANLAAKLDGVAWTIGGENVGMGLSLRSLQSTFMASKPHRRNILREGFDHTAIGIVESDGSLWVTVIFYG